MTDNPERDLTAAEAQAIWAAESYRQQFGHRLALRIADELTPVIAREFKIAFARIFNEMMALTPQEPDDAQAKP